MTQHILLCKHIYFYKIIIFSICMYWVCMFVVYAEFMDNLEQ